MGRQEKRAQERARDKAKKHWNAAEQGPPQPTPEQEQLLEMSGELQKTEGLLNLLRATKERCTGIGEDYVEVLDRLQERENQVERDLADAMIEMVLIADPEFDDKKIELPTSDEIASLS